MSKTVAEKLRATAKRLRQRKPRRRPEGPLNAQCPCGYGFSELGGTVYLSPHAMDCPALKRIVAIERSGICATCGARKVSERNGEIVCCPSGCSHAIRGEAFLELMDASGSPWIRDALKG